ncbi:hypothetical protein [Streptomyces sp. enrichment culture]|uniref:hypothetical protein n=1 Tax=Streptomyces sp. enrichment culture TaxID=1795815 RepID=UPI003F55639A
MPRTDARRGAWALVLVVLVLCVCPGAAGTPPYGERGHGDRTPAAHASDAGRVSGAAHASDAGRGSDARRGSDAGRVSGAAYAFGGARAADRPARITEAAASRPHPVAAPAREGRPPGCRGDSRADDGGLAPAAPPRGLTAGDLLPAPHDARGAFGCAGWTPREPGATGPGRAPPPLAPPSPMDLSILRV